MRVRRSALTLATAACLAASTSVPVLAEHDWDERGAGRYRGGEYKEKFREGPCRVERELKRDGSYKEERECKGGRDTPYRHRQGEYEEKYWDGPCKVEREWKRDGSYKEKIDCEGYAQGSRPARASVAITAPPWIVFERSGPVYRLV